MLFLSRWALSHIMPPPSSLTQARPVGGGRARQVWLIGLGVDVIDIMGVGVIGLDVTGVDVSAPFEHCKRLMG